MDYVDEIMSRVSGNMDNLDEIEAAISGMVEVGALTEVGAAAMRRALRAGGRPALTRVTPGMAPPSPPFGRSARETERRSPLGFQTAAGAFSWALAAAIDATTTIRAKVSRPYHPDRLLIIPSAAGAVIDSFKIGDEEQLAAPGAPVELYGTAALTDTMPDNFSPLSTGVDAILTLRNTTAGAITGTAGLKGSVPR